MAEPRTVVAAAQPVMARAGIDTDAAWQVIGGFQGSQHDGVVPGRRADHLIAAFDQDCHEPVQAGFADAGLSVRGIAAHKSILPSRSRGHTPISESIHPRAKYSRNPKATIHSSGLISRALPDAERSTAQAMNPTPMPLAIE